MSISRKLYILEKLKNSNIIVERIGKDSFSFICDEDTEKEQIQFLRLLREGNYNTHLMDFKRFPAEYISGEEIDIYVDNLYSEYEEYLKDYENTLPEYIGTFPVRQDITVLPYYEPRKLKDGWSITWD